jgi:hypothetical protein
MDRLPPGIRATLTALTADRQAGRQPTLVHHARLLNALGAAAQFEDPELAQTVLWLLSVLNDLYRDNAKTISTTEANLRSDVLKAIDVAPDKQAAMREVHALIRRRLPHVTLATVRNWHRDRQRVSRRGRVDPAVQTRLDLGLPLEAGTTDEARYHWLIARIAKATEPPVTG